MFFFQWVTFQEKRIEKIWDFKMQPVLLEQEIEQEKTNTLPAYKKLRGLDRNGKPLFIRVDVAIQKVLDKAIKRNREKNWDYVCPIVGYVGIGKSVAAQGFARYCDDKFDEHQIAFNAEEFIAITNRVPEFSSVILDESFQSMNTRVTMSPDFLKIVNHLQLIRQKHLFIFLCLPNFFDLSKTIAIFRCNHLFVCYSNEKGERGRILAFDRNAKRRLYIKGSKYIDYEAEPANFRAQFYKNEKIIPEEVYNKQKFDHLVSQDEVQVDFSREVRKKLILYLKEEKGFQIKEISKVSGMSTSRIEKDLHEIRKQRLNESLTSPKTVKTYAP